MEKIVAETRQPAYPFGKRCALSLSSGTHGSEGLYRSQRAG
jgi:hypothetical protein